MVRALRLFLLTSMALAAPLAAQDSTPLPPLTPPPPVRVPLHYDPYFVLPGYPGDKGVDVKFDATDAGAIGDVGDILVMGKMAFDRKAEAGAMLSMGVFNDAAKTFSSFVLGFKYALGPLNAATLNLLTPVGDVDDLGISLGYMHALESGALGLNSHLQVGLLDGYSGGRGTSLALLLQPTLPLGPRWRAYLDARLATNSDDFGGRLAIDLNPNLDYLLADGAALNLGLSFGLAGDARQRQTGLVVGFLKILE